MRHAIKRWFQRNFIVRFFKRLSSRIETTNRYVKNHGYSYRRAWKYSGWVI